MSTSYDVTFFDADGLVIAVAYFQVLDRAELPVEKVVELARRSGIKFRVDGLFPDERNSELEAAITAGRVKIETSPEPNPRFAA